MGLFGTNLDLNSIDTAYQEGTKDGTSFDAADGVNLALDAAASAIPFGALIKDFLDKLGLAQNIELALKYGLNSWGASTSPEAMQAFYGTDVYPWIQNMMEQIDGSNMERIINQVDMQLRANKYFHRILRDHHSRADSTRLANDWAINELDRLLTEIHAGLKAEFTKVNISIVRTDRAFADFADFGITAFVENNRPFANDDANIQNNPYYTYKIDASRFSSAKVGYDANGNIVVSKNNNLMMGGLAMAGLAFFWFKGMKKLK